MFLLRDLCPGILCPGSLCPRTCLCPGEGISVQWGFCPWGRGLCQGGSLCRGFCPEVSVQECVSAQGGEVIVQGSLCPGESLPRGSLPRGRDPPYTVNFRRTCCWKSCWKLWQHGQYVAYRSTPTTTYNNIIYSFIIYTRTIMRSS